MIFQHYPMQSGEGASAMTTFTKRLFLQQALQAHLLREHLHS